MGRVTFTSDNKSKDLSGYPKFRLEQKGQRARFCLIEPEPMMRRVHTLRMPVVENGRIQMETKQGRRGDYEVPVTEYVGMHMCSGRDEVFESGKALDPEACDICAKAKSNPDQFDPPYRRFAQHVLVYKTQAGTAKVAEPFQAELKVWVYSDGRFDSVVDMVEEHGNPRGFDVIAGPCQIVSFQKYDIQAGGSAEWAKTEDRKKLVAEIWRHNQCEDLEGMIARKPNKAFITADIDKVMDRWADVGNEGRSSDEAAAADINDLNDLLGESSPSSSEDTSTGTDSDLSDLLDSPSTSTDETVQGDVDLGLDDEPQQEAPKSEKDKKDDGVVSFDDLLDDI